MSNPNTESFEDQIETFEHMVTVLMVLSGDAREAEFEKSSLVYSKDQTTASVLDAKAMKYAKSWWEERQATIDQRVAAERVKLIAMALSDAAFAAGQVEGLTGKPDPYWTRRLETLNRHLDEARSLTKKGESKS